MRSGQWFVAIIVGAVLSGCATPEHSNTLLFATNTAVALDVSANPTTASPNITIGYKRQEMAWVPLLANASGPQSERQPAKCEQVEKYGCVFAGRDSTGVDAYSVLATFKGTATGKTSGGSASPSTEAGGSIAQFFATGLAARILADKGGAHLVSTAASSDAAQVVLAWQQQEQSDEKKLDAYFNDPTKFAQQRDALVDNSKWKGTSTGDDLKKLSDKAAFMDWVYKNFAAHDLASSIPNSGAGGSAQPAQPAAAPVPTVTPAAAVPPLSPST